ncbi:hypothetical protein HK097_005637 [Rhizophlyctis rosea]|uniref:TmcB/TmcC TPR repeats domain-containing protein n=1 Tax=Rhizophlyctis rosea TaxID=64517 RepID=A0AAD5SEV3_9FUNG|nr:hypothetical protein HK097_005637 [Rhizophlyctis rosea]
MSVLGILGLLVVIPMGVLINFVFVIPKPESRNPLAKATGRFDLAYFIIRTILVFMGYYARASSQLVISLVALLIIIVLHLYYEPFFDSRVNNFRVAMFTIPFFSSVVATACWFTGASLNRDSPVPLALMILTIPTGFISGWYLAEITRRMRVRSIINNITRKYELASKDLEDGKEGVDKFKTNVLTSAIMGMETDTRGGRKSIRRPSFVLQTIATGSTVKEAPGQMDTVAAMRQYNQEASRKAVQMPTVFFHPGEADIAMRFLRNSEVTPVGIQILHGVFREAMDQFPKDAQLSLMYSFYLSAWAFDSRSAVEYLAAAKSYKPAIDVRFRIFMEERDFEQGNRRNLGPLNLVHMRLTLEVGQRAQDFATSSLNVASYVEVQSMERQAIESHLESLSAMKAFWTYLAQEPVDPAALPTYLDMMHRTQDSAQKYYEKLVARYPRSKNTLRMYAKYLMVVANNNELGQELISRAADIEAQEEKGVRERAAQAFGKGSEPQPDSASSSGEEEPEPISPGLTLPREDLDDAAYKEESTMELGGGLRSMASDPAFGRPKPQSDDIGSSKMVRGLTEFDMEVGEAPVVKVHRASYEQSPIRGPMEGSPGALQAGKAKSVASSSASRKEYRRLKARQTRLKENLLAPVSRFSIYVRLACLVILGLIVANFLVSSSLFDAPTSFLATLVDSTRAGRAAMQAAQEIRLMSQYGLRKEETPWNYHREQLASAAMRFDDVILPVLFPYANDPATVYILQPESDGLGADKEVITVNAYTLGRLVGHSTQNLLVYDYTQWTDSAFPANKYVTLWFTNALKIGDAFNQLSKDALKTYLAGSATRNTTVVTLMVLVVFGVIAVGCFIHVTLRHGYHKQMIVLKTFTRLPNVERRRIVHDLEEEIEGLFEIEDNAERKDSMRHQSVEGKSVLRSHKVVYMIALLLLACLALAQFIPPLLSASQSDKAAKIIMTSSERRYLYQVIGYLGHELPAQDYSNAGIYEIEDELRLRIYLLKTLHRSLLAGTAGVPSTGTIPELDPICRTGGICLADRGCDDRPFNHTIGYTKELLLSGLDNLLDVYVEHASEYLKSHSYTYDNEDLYFLQNLEDDLADGLTKVGSTIIEVERVRSDGFIRITNVMFSTSIVYFVVFYALVFYWIISAARTQMAMLVTVLFWIPPEIATKSAEIQKYLVSGTVEATEE